jgi:hypothetical protein
MPLIVMARSAPRPFAPSVCLIVVSIARFLLDGFLVPVKRRAARRRQRARQARDGGRDRPPAE